LAGFYSQHLYALLRFRLFLTPMFDAEALEQSLLYSRRNDLDFEKTPEVSYLAVTQSILLVMSVFAVNYRGR